jgi:hypothetical protein
MSCPLGARGFTLLACSLVLATVAATGCTSASGDDDATAPFGITVGQFGITVENRTGTTLVDGKVEIIPAGRIVVFSTSWPRMETAERREFIMDGTFRGSDGTPFRRGAVRARSIRVSAKDMMGKLYEREVPFD